MSCRNTTETYGCATKTLHALVAIFFTVQLIFGVVMTTFIDDSQLQSFCIGLHKSTGLILFCLGLIFAVWSWFNPKPVWPVTMKKWERFLARTTHFLLYWLVVLMPLSGWIGSTAGGRAPVFFWLFKVPLAFIPLNKSLASFCFLLHEIFAWSLGVLVALHILGALKHHFIDKNTILRRMWS